MKLLTRLPIQNAVGVKLNRAVGEVHKIHGTTYRWLPYDLSMPEVEFVSQGIPAMGGYVVQVGAGVPTYMTDSEFAQQFNEPS